MPTPPGRRLRLESYGLGAAVLAVVVLVLLLRPTSGAEQSRTGEGTSPGDTSSTGAEPSEAQSADTPARATERDFCAGFVRLAESQAAFAGDGGGAAALEEAAQALVGTGVPDSMSLPARSGYYAVIGGVHDSLGLELEPGAVGAPRAPAEGGDAAFSAYLGQHCPA